MGNHQLGSCEEKIRDVVLFNIKTNFRAKAKLVK